MALALKSRWRRWFERKRRRADRLIESPARVSLTVERAEAKARRQGKLRQSWDDIQTLGRLVRAWVRGDYRDVSRSTIVLVLGALVYLLSPIDAILDSIPLLGYLDDAAVISWVMSEVRAEIDQFREAESRTALEAVDKAV
jgi:uncharacterized membrane protein YkvA (DUF1232 family)